MSAVLPWVLTALTGVVLAAGVVALWQSLRAVFGVASTVEARGTSVSEERTGLLDEKAALLRSIRDLELDRESGKISDADFQRLDTRLRTRAREVLQQLDQEVAPYRPAAEALVARALGQEAPVGTSDAPAPDASESAAAPSPGEEGEAPATAAPVSCPACGAPNDADAVFCKKCGARVAEAAGGVA
jgi:hypothetical protein